MLGNFSYSHELYHPLVAFQKDISQVIGAEPGG